MFSVGLAFLASAIWPVPPLSLPDYTHKANTMELNVVAPTTAQPATMTFLFESPLPVSQTKYLTPLMQWNANGQATQNLMAAFATTGRAPNAAAILVDDRSQLR